MYNIIRVYDIRMVSLFGLIKESIVFDVIRGYVFFIRLD